MFWRRDACREVLPLVTGEAFSPEETRAFRLDRLQCRVHTLAEPAHDCLHVLFAEDGRWLQLEIAGARHLEGGVLLTPILPSRNLRTARFQAMRRFADVMARGTLRTSLYPVESRNARLLHVVEALDGALAGTAHRNIAIGLFGGARVDEEWHGSNNYLRDHVRRAIAYGRELMTGGYQRFLR